MSLSWENGCNCSFYWLLLFLMYMGLKVSHMGQSSNYMKDVYCKMDIPITSARPTPPSVYCFENPLLIGPAVSVLANSVRVGQSQLSSHFPQRCNLLAYGYLIIIKCYFPLRYAIGMDIEKLR